MDPVFEAQVAQFESRLLIRRESLDDELVRQPHFYFEVADAAALAHSRAAAEKDNVSVIEAMLFRKFKATGERSNPEVDASVKTHEKRIAAFGRYLRAVQEASRYDALKDAFQQRSYALKDLANLTASGFLSQNSVRGPSAAIADRAYEVRREEIAKKRKPLKTGRVRTRE